MFTPPPETHRPCRSRGPLMHGGRGVPGGRGAARARGVRRTNPSRETSAFSGDSANSEHKRASKLARARVEWCRPGHLQQAARQERLLLYVLAIALHRRPFAGSDQDRHFGAPPGQHLGRGFARHQTFTGGDIVPIARGEAGHEHRPVAAGNRAARSGVRRSVVCCSGYA